MKRCFRPLVCLVSAGLLQGCATSAGEVTSVIESKPPVVEVVSTESTDNLVVCISRGLQKFDREVTLARRTGGATLIVGVMESPQYVIDIDEVDGKRRATMRRRTMLFQNASEPIAEVLRTCAR